MVREGQGLENAQLNLGTLFRAGKGIKQSFSEAFHWFEKAAQQGNAIAQFEIAMLNFQGRGVVQSNTQAIRWRHQAAKRGHSNAQKLLD